MAIIILFGLAGAGKTYTGLQLAHYINGDFYDGDDWLTEEMQQAISLKQPFTQAMRDRFTLHIIEEIRTLQAAAEKGRHIIVAQGLYKQQNRQMISQAFPKAIFIEIRASLEVIKSRLQRRGDTVDANYANVIAKNFEPMPGSFVLHNNLEGKQYLQMEIEKTWQEISN